MFSDTLLDSSPKRTPVLTPGHWAAALLIASTGWAIGYVLLPSFAPFSPRGRVAVSILLGICLTCYELMLFYVRADARRLGLNVARWSLILLLINLVGFAAYLVCAARRTGDWKRAALPLAYAFEIVVVIGLALVPLIRTEALPSHFWVLTQQFAPPPPPGAPPARSQQRARPARNVSLRSPNEIIAPTIIPRIIAVVRDEHAEAPAPDRGAWVPGGVPGGGVPGGVPFSIWPEGNTPPPPPPNPTHPSTRRVRQSSGVTEAKLVYRPQPIYPEIARISHTEGTVVLQAIISKEGTIQDLKVLSGNPLLINSAMDAVARWRYQPTLLNGDAVEVLTEIEVKFTLGDR